MAIVVGSSDRGEDVGGEVADEPQCSADQRAEDLLGDPVRRVLAAVRDGNAPAVQDCGIHRQGVTERTAVPPQQAEVPCRRQALAVHLDLIFLGLTFRGRFLLIDQSDGVLGRNILNHLNVVFNGPGLLWETVK